MRSSTNDIFLITIFLPYWIQFLFPFHLSWAIFVNLFNFTEQKLSLMRRCVIDINENITEIFRNEIFRFVKIFGGEEKN